MGGPLTLLVVVVDIIAIIDVLKSAKGTGKKALWAVLILLLPGVGLILYYFVGKKSS